MGWPGGKDWPEESNTGEWDFNDPSARQLDKGIAVDASATEDNKLGLDQITFTGVTVVHGLHHNTGNKDHFGTGYAVDGDVARSDINQKGLDYMTSEDRNRVFIMQLNFFKSDDGAIDNYNQNLETVIKERAAPSRHQTERIPPER